MPPVDLDAIFTPGPDVVLPSEWVEGVNNNVGRIDPLGAWTAYTPTVKFGTTVQTINGTDARYMRVGRLVIAEVFFRLSSVSGTGTFYMSLPVTPAAYAAAAQAYMRPIGHMNAITVPGGTVCETVVVYEQSSNQAYFRAIAGGSGALSNSSPNTWAANDDFQAQLLYRADADA